MRGLADAWTEIDWMCPARAVPAAVFGDYFLSLAPVERFAHEGWVIRGFDCIWNWDLKCWWIIHSS